ncbi:Alpha/Beta hydrolase fold, partial [Arabidopsis suecica]
MGSWIPKLLLLQLVLLLTKHADSSSIIRYLPGFEGPLPFELETGYIGVGEEDEDQMFYYFIKSESNPEEDPLLLWLSGGPGCSSFTGLVYENGPLGFKVEAYNGSIPTLVSTTYSWTKVANIIYLDQPVGTEYFSNPFYAGGNSYSGKMVPVIVQEISNGNCICCKPQIRLQGYVLGSPVTDYDLDRNSRIQFAHGMALISNELYESMKRTCGGNYIIVDPLNTECLELIKHYEKCVSGIYENLILAPKCDLTSPDCHLYEKFLLQGTTGKWERCKWSLQNNKDIKSSIPYHKKNSIEGYRSLIFSGDHDMLTPYIGTQDWIRSLNYSIIDKWRPWMILDQVAGYTTTYANKMTFATVKGGGHTLDYKPEENSILFQRWISGQP